MLSIVEDLHSIPRTGENNQVRKAKLIFHLHQLSRERFASLVAQGWLVSVWY